MDTVQNGKGSARRHGADDKAYRENWDRIFGGRRVDYEDDAQQFADQVIEYVQQCDKQEFPG